jgi:hypothetical protein
MNLFLETASIMGSEGASDMLSVLAAAFLAVFLVVLVAGFLIYIYMSLAYMAIAKKANNPHPAIAWIPGVGPLIIAFQASKMHWWPWLLLIGYFIPVVSIFAALAFAVFSVIWSWKLFEAIGKPGWWAILMMIPLVNLVILGIAAWSKN